MTEHISCRSLTQIRLHGGQNGGCARHGNSIHRVNTGKIDGTSDFLDVDREIKRRLIDNRNMITRLSWTASSRQLLLQGYGWYLKHSYFISSVIAYCISPYASFSAGLSCCMCRAKAWENYSSVVIIIIIPVFTPSLQPKLAKPFLYFFLLPLDSTEVIKFFKQFWVEN